MHFILSVLSLSAVLRLGTDSLVLLMNALKRKGRVWVGKKNTCRTKLDGWRKRERQRKEYQVLYLYYNASQDR